ncbi:MAG TPA: hypothetical protein VIN07_02040, partial [Flavipsychrobacter sp.]
IMNDKESKVSSEIKELINRLSSNIARNHLKITEILNDKIEMDLTDLRDEICYCILCGFNQAAITLTNHFLERLLKLALIEKETGIRFVDLSEEQEEKYNRVCTKYDSKNLHDTINICCTQGLITKDIKKNLIVYKEQFRNAFSHASAEKTFKGLKVPLAMGKFENPTEIVQREVTVSNYPLLYNIMQQNIADTKAFPYFKEVYSTLKYIDSRLHQA